MRTVHLPRALRWTAAAVVVAVACGPPEETPVAEQPWFAPMQTGEQAFRQQKLPEAETAFREALAIATTAGSVQGRVIALEGLATTRALQGDMAAADSLYRVVLGLQERRFAADSLAANALVRVLGSLGEINLRLQRPVEAEAFFLHILDLAAGGDIDLNAEEPALAFTVRGLGEARAARGDMAHADSLRRRAAGLQLYAKGFAAYIGEDLDAAEDAYRQALLQQTAGVGGTGADIGRTSRALAQLLELQGKDDEALTFYARAAHAYATDPSAPIDHAATLRDWADALPAAQAARADSLRQQAAELLASQPP